MCLGWWLRRALKLDELSDRLAPTGREMIHRVDVIAILVIGRLCEPSSDRINQEVQYDSRPT